ncbi:SPEF1 protein, partial [Alopecoenas beccarii]|nr:SPEF1 protein [Alopecoenas beccarii]
MVQLHSYVPASSTSQKLANWGHLNRKVLSKLNFSIPADVIREVVQCRPGTVEQVLLLLRQKIEEKQKQGKAVPGPGQPHGLRAVQHKGSVVIPLLPFWVQGDKEPPWLSPGPPGHCRPPAAGREGAGAAPGA